ncbi:MAG: hypothetical protein IJ512_05860 [Ruminococcus sp.]|nr:hypothetical protein [Ruminococcus sp.]
MEETVPQKVMLLLLTSEKESEQFCENMTVECRRMQKSPVARALLEQQLRSGVMEILTKIERIRDSD